MIGAVRKSRASRFTECVGMVEGLSIAPKSAHLWARMTLLCRCMVVIREMSESPELELIYGALAEIDKKLDRIDEALRVMGYSVLPEISDRLEKINKNLIELNTILERMWREGLIVKERLSP